jgi:hypothetical protein
LGDPNQQFQKGSCTQLTIGQPLKMHKQNYSYEIYNAPGEELVLQSPMRNLGHMIKWDKYVLVRVPYNGQKMPIPNFFNDLFRGVLQKYKLLKGQTEIDKYDEFKKRVIENYPYFPAYCNACQSNQCQPILKPNEAYHYLLPFTHALTDQQKEQLSNHLNELAEGDLNLIFLLTCEYAKGYIQERWWVNENIPEEVDIELSLANKQFTPYPLDRELEYRLMETTIQLTDFFPKTLKSLEFIKDTLNEELIIINNLQTQIKTLQNRNVK